MSAEVQRLTEEARRSDAPKDPAPGRCLMGAATFANVARIKKASAAVKAHRRSDLLDDLLKAIDEELGPLSALNAVQVVKVPEFSRKLTEADMTKWLRVDKRWTAFVNGFHECLRRLDEAVESSRLSPSPQPATGAALTCDDCDSREGCPKRGTPCMYHMSDVEPQPSADVVVVPRGSLESVVINIQRTPKIGDAYDSLVDALRSSPQPSADVVAVPREEWEATIAMAEAFVTEPDMSGTKEEWERWNRLLKSRPAYEKIRALRSSTNQKPAIVVGDCVTSEYRNDLGGFVRHSFSGAMPDAIIAQSWDYRTPIVDGSLDGLTRYSEDQVSMEDCLKAAERRKLATNHDAQDAGEGR